MDMQKFLEQYANNLLEALKDHSFRVDSIDWICGLCPLQEACNKDTLENPGSCPTCGEFITKNLTDGSEYKA